MTFYKYGEPAGFFVTPKSKLIPGAYQFKQKNIFVLPIKLPANLVL